MRISPSLLPFLTGSSGSVGDTLTSLAMGKTVSTSTSSGLDPVTLYTQALKAKDKGVAQKAKDPIVARDIAAFKKGVAEAKSVDDLLANRKVMNVILSASGLSDYLDSKALVSKALKSDLTDTKSLANKLGQSNGAWLTAAKTYDFAASGLQVLQDKDFQKSIANAYAEVKWQEDLDAQAPGVSSALAFKSMASSLKSVYNILGNGVAREVVTTALGVPPQIAYQSLPGQVKAITAKLKVENLQDPKFVDALVKRYLLEKSFG